jgi:glycosyltransferase involved in cell wall biosynthesis
MANPTIFVLAPSVDVPSGGIRKLYRHVDVLNKHGFSASILHEQSGFRCTWFVNDTRVSYAADTPRVNSDYLVIPEIYGPRTVHMVRGMNKVIFNQSGYATFKDYTLDQQDLVTPYTDAEFLATIVVSRDSELYLQYAFRNHKVFRIHNSIDPSLFYPADKRRQICFMPNKNPGDLVQVINLLKFRNALADFELAPIAGKTETEAARILRESLIFLSLGHPEGFGLPAAEAMACGCITVGYHGRGGAEFFRNEFAFPIEAGDTVGFAKAVEEVVQRYRCDPGPLSAMAEQASAFIRSEYSLEREESDIVRCWTEILNRWASLGPVR